jgi:hypothetical protein
MWSAAGGSEQVFVANRINDITHSNGAIVYYLLDAAPASWMIVFEPGFTDQERYQRVIVEDLCQSRAAVVLMETPRASEHPPDRRFSPYLDRFLALNYTLTDVNGHFDLRQLSVGSCVLPEEVDPDEVLEARRRDLLAAGDLIPALVIGEWQAELRPGSPESTDRLLLAAVEGGLWHAPEELPGRRSKLLSRWLAPQAYGLQAIELDPLDGTTSGAMHYVNALLAARDLATGAGDAAVVTEQLAAAPSKDSSLSAFLGRRRLCNGPLRTAVRPQPPC